MNKEEVENIVDLYFQKKVSKDNDYMLFFEDGLLINQLNNDTNELTSSKTKDIPTRVNILSPPGKVLSDDDIQRLDPDNIDISHFWRYCVEKFPNFSISGYHECKNEDDVNTANLNFAIWCGLISKMDSLLKQKPDAKILEIGPGYGSIFNHITSKYDRCNYLAIDVNPLFYYDGLFECDGKSIPEEAGDEFDMVISSNVFQHLSQKQRSSYYLEVFNKLKSDGIFVFTNFLIADENRDAKEYWSYMDKEGRPYSTFFSQLTPVDEYNDLADELNEIGFSINVNLKQNFAVITCEKHD